MFAIVSFIGSDDEGVARRILQASHETVFVRIGEDGILPIGVSLQAGQVAFFGNLQAAGVQNLQSGAPGLDLLPQCIFADGRKQGFMEFFAFYRSEGRLHNLTVLFMEADTCLTLQDGRFTVGGEGGVAVIHPRNGGSSDQPDIAQYRSGDSFPRW